MLEREVMRVAIGPSQGAAAPFRRMVMRTKPSLSLDEAHTLATACVEAARRHGVAVSIAVVDEAGALLHFTRMDGARAYTVDLATQKARTAAAIGVSTGVLESIYKDRPTQSRETTATRGGLPLMHEGQCAGAVGVSGAKPEIDDEIGGFGLEVLKTEALSTR